MDLALRGRERSRRVRTFQNNLVGWLFVLPWFLGFAVFTAGPMVASGFLAFTDWNLVGELEFVGLQNWQKMFTDDPLVLKSLRVSAVFAMTSVPLQAAISLGLAVLLNQKIRGLSIYRTVIFLPSLISGVALAMLWRWLFSPDLGLINYTLSFIGIKGPAWLIDRAWALPSLVLTTLWGVGGMVLIYLAALQGVPTSLYEAAEVDGARAWNKFWSITLPMISPAIFFQILMGIINALQEFILGHVMTDGGPMNATLFCVLYLYRLGFEQFRMGYASAVAWVLFLVILVLTVIVLRSSSMWVYYEGMQE
jgi:multiple sugar transport system permease protein